MTTTCHRAIRSLRKCERLNLTIALEATLHHQPRMARYFRALAITCRRDARLLQTTAR